jgi:galactose mutarotase-like enzyme
MSEKLRCLLCLLLGCALASPSTFTITEYAVGQRHVQVLANSETGESVEVLQDWGGKLSRIQLSKANTLRDVIATRCPDPKKCTAADLEGQATLGALLIPFANRILNGQYKFSGKMQYLSPTNETVSQGFLVNGRPMAVLSATATRKDATLVLGYNFNGSDVGYPFHVAVNVSYILSTAGLTVTIRAKNLMASSPAPFMAGCHPYFKLLHGFAKAKVS